MQDHVHQASEILTLSKVFVNLGKAYEILNVFGTFAGEKAII